MGVQPDDCTEYVRQAVASDNTAVQPGDVTGFYGVPGSNATVQFVDSNGMVQACESNGYLERGIAIDNTHSNLLVELDQCSDGVDGAELEFIDSRDELVVVADNDLVVIADKDQR